MGATKPSRPAKRRTSAEAADQGSDDEWSSSASNFVPEQRTKTTKAATRNKKVSDDKVVKREYNVKKVTKAALKSRNNDSATGTARLTAAALEQHNAMLGEDIDQPASFSYTRRTVNGLELSRLTDALDLQYGPSLENFGGHRLEEFNSDLSSVGGEPMMANSGRVSRPKKPKGAAPNTNGRVVGRILVKWHRPRMAEKLLLHTQYECHRRNIALPWDKIVRRLSPGSSGFSALQHLNKLRDMLVTEGHMVPPLLGKKHVPQDPTIRGFIRDMNGVLPNTTRVVRWGEPIEDPKYNLVVPGLVRGSGTYPRKGGRGQTKTLETATKLEGQRRDRRPIELRDATKPAPNISRRGRPGPKPGSTYRKTRETELLAAEVEHLENSNVRGGYGLRKTEPKSFREDEDLDADTDVDGNDESGTEAPQSPQRRASERLTPPPTMPVTLHLPPRVLSKFPKGTSHAHRQGVDHYNLGIASHLNSPEAEEGVSAASKNGNNSNHQADRQRSTERRYSGAVNTSTDGNAAAINFFNPKLSVFTALDTGYIRHGSEHAAGAVHRHDANSSEGPVVARRKSIEVNQFEAVASYQGRDEHGTMTDYLEALSQGVDPRVNGLHYQRLVDGDREGAGAKLGSSHGRIKNLHERRQETNRAREQIRTLDSTAIKPNDRMTRDVNGNPSDSQAHKRGGTSAKSGNSSTSRLSAELPHKIDFGGETPRNTVSMMDVEAGAAWQAQQRLAKLQAETPTIIRNPDGTVETYKTWQSAEDFQQVDTVMVDHFDHYSGADGLPASASLGSYTESAPAVQPFYQPIFQGGSFDQSTGLSANLNTHFANPNMHSSFFTQSSFDTSQGSFNDVEGTNLFPSQMFQQPVAPGFQIQGHQASDQYMHGHGHVNNTFMPGSYLTANMIENGDQSFNNIMQSVETDDGPHTLATRGNMYSSAFSANIQADAFGDFVRYTESHERDDLAGGNGEGVDGIKRESDYLQ